MAGSQIGKHPPLLLHAYELYLLEYNNIRKTLQTGL